ncbi:MAG: VIT domain-containing protein [Rhodothermales bacterium]
MEHIPWNRGFFLACIGLLLTSWPAGAQGIVVGHDARPVMLELRRHRVDADIQERLAVVTVTHEFSNTGHATVEGTFLFPLPPEAQVSRFSMEVDGREMNGELLSADEARRIYEDIVRRSLDPALLEMADYRTFRARIFPIPPGAKRTITLRYDATLPMDGRTATFRYPLQGSLSYQAAGLPRPVHHRRGEDQKRPDHDGVASQQSLIHVTIRTDTGVKNIYSPSHAIDVRREHEGHAEAVFEATNALDGRDFVLYYSVDSNEIGATMLAHRPYSDRPGYFMLLLDPPVELDESRIQPQDIIFVLDTSGSMSGDKMKQAKDALRYCLTHLGARDRFGLIAFSTDVDAFRDELRPASAGDDALYFVDQLEANGGTNINQALLAATAMLKNSDNGLIVFLTDGLPSVGETSEAKIRANIQGAGNKVRLFSFGVGYDVNTHLLDGLSGASGAFADYISPEASIDEHVSAFFDKVRYPVMTDLKLDLDGVEAYAYVPGTLPNLYKGNQLILAGRYRRAGEATVTLQGRIAGQIETKRYTFRFPETERERDFVARLWATRRVGQLLEAIRLNGENDELKEEIIALAKEFGLVTPYTSYLVQEEERVAAHRGVLVPDDVQLNEIVVTQAPPKEAMDQVSGAGAVRASKQLRAMQEAEAAPMLEATGVAAVQGQTLRRNAEGAWITLDYTQEKTKPVQLKFASEAYFTFLRLYPEATEFARLGQQITFAFRGQFVQIGEEGEEKMSEARLQSLFM